MSRFDSAAPHTYKAEVVAHNTARQQRTARELTAYAENLMPTRKQELIGKVQALVRNKWAGSYKTAFEAYDGDMDGVIVKAELIVMLADAGIGTLLTRNAWADGVIRKLDLNTDSGVSWAEFEAAIVRG